MEIFYSITTLLSSHLRTHLTFLSVGFVATILVIFGTDLVHQIKEPLKKIHFVFRLAILIAVSAIGFSLLTNFGNKMVADFLRSLPDRWFSVVVIAAFIGLGLIAEKKKFM